MPAYASVGESQGNRSVAGRRKGSRAAKPRDLLKLSCTQAGLRTDVSDLGQPYRFHSERRRTCRFLGMPNRLRFRYGRQRCMIGSHHW